MKRLYLTAVHTVPSEEGQKRIDEALSKSNGFVEEVFRDEHGHTREFYEDVAGKVPKGFAEAEKEFYSKNQESEIDENGNMYLQPEEIEYAFTEYLVPLKRVVDVEDTLEFGSMLTLDDGRVVHIEETVEDVNYMIYLLTMSKWDKFLNKINSIFNSFWRKITNKKQVDLDEILSRPENQPEYKQ